jgi:DNA-binding NarL/FixJ family response regulator
LIRVAVADDHPIVRNGLRRLIEFEHDMSMVIEAGDAVSLLDQLRQTTCDVLVLDINMPGRSGLDILPDIFKLCPGLPVLILSMHPESQFAVNAIRAGVYGYLSKGSADEELIRAIRYAVAGKKFITATVAEMLANAMHAGGDRPLHELLSGREYEVLRLMASGKGSSEIADQLFLSIKTVSTYKTRILEKMNLSNSAEIIAYAIRNGLVD